MCYCKHSGWQLIREMSPIFAAFAEPLPPPDPCSVPEYKANVVKVMRSILRENVRRGTKGDAAPDRGCRERLAPLRGTLPSSARIGEHDRRPPTPSSISAGGQFAWRAPPARCTHSLYLFMGRLRCPWDRYRFTAGPGWE